MHEELDAPTQEEHKRHKKNLYITFQGEESCLKRGVLSFLYGIKWLILLSMSVTVFMIIPVTTLLSMKHFNYETHDIVVSVILIIIFQILVIAAWVERPWKKGRF